MLNFILTSTYHSQLIPDCIVPGFFSVIDRNDFEITIWSECLKYRLKNTVAVSFNATMRQRLKYFSNQISLQNDQNVSAKKNQYCTLVPQLV